MNSSPSDTAAGGSRTIVRDALLAFTLFASLGVVYGLDRLTPPAPPAAPAQAPKIVVREVETQPQQAPQQQAAPLRLAVTPPSFDDVGKLLDGLGNGYKYTTIQYDELLDEKRLADFDVLFVTCSGVPDTWVDKVLENADRPGTVNVQVKPEVLDRARANLRKFVEQGGTLYASDFQFSLVALAFPEFIDRNLVRVGKAQTVTAEAIDASLKNLLGSQIPLKFDMDGWHPAAMQGQEVIVLLWGDYKAMDDSEQSAPLLVKFPVKQGNVVFTSFHNEKQNSELESKLLRFLVFTTVLARTEARLTQTLVEGGFSPAARSLLSASGDEQSVTQTHRVAKRGPVRFALGFENRGATLTLTVEGPGDAKFDKAGQSSFSLDIPDAVPGDWKYTIKASNTPFANFPFTLTIGEK